MRAFRACVVCAKNVCTIVYYSSSMYTRWRYVVQNGKHVTHERTHYTTMMHIIDDDDDVHVDMLPHAAC